MIAKNVPDKAHSEQSAQQSEQSAPTICVDATQYKLVGIMTPAGVMECLVHPDELENSAVLGRTEYDDRLVTVLQLRNGERVLYM